MHPYLYRLLGHGRCLFDGHRAHSVVITFRKSDTIADDLLAADAVLFLVAGLLSYWALRTRSIRRMHRVERLADGIFIFAMIVMTGVCALITYAVSAVAK